ncbi:hypothetical protein Y032_0863g2752 [Ancylostoma ceylanicum]|uniref:Uncharacterized protein n=1 Tax=Ancylostoma ceylanicum TaxID=53326 RepID=A0A016WA62_9BILA|nr:hypothetical protein Y032_0863g2752 [Ancylostoma ceylanicum]
MSGARLRDINIHDMEVDRRGTSSRRGKRLAAQSKTHPTIQAKQNQLFFCGELGRILIATAATRRCIVQSIDITSWTVLWETSQ